MIQFRNKIVLDETDRKLLEALKQDGKITYAELARDSGISRAAITKRVNALIAKGVIEKFTVVMNPGKLGYTISVLFEITALPAEAERIIERLRDREEISRVYLTGTASIFAFAFFEDNKKMEVFLMEVLNKIPGIQNIKTNLLLSEAECRSFFDKL